MSIKENESTTLRGKGEKSFYHNCNFGFFQAALSLGKSPENLLLLQHWPCCLLLQWASSRLCFSCPLYHPPAPVFLVLPPLCLSPCAGALDVAAPTPIPLSWPLNAEQPWQRQDWGQVVGGGQVCTMELGFSSLWQGQLLLFLLPSAQTGPGGI